MHFARRKKKNKKTSRKSEKGVDKAGRMMYTVKVAARETETVATSVIENWTTKRKKHKELKKLNVWEISNNSLEKPSKENLCEKQAIAWANESNDSE